MKLTVLTENTASRIFSAEHGVSYLISQDNCTVLFDTGNSDNFLRNAALLGINLDEIVDFVVLSHGHWDHGNGLRFIGNKPLITHPGSFLNRFNKNGTENIGLILSKETIQEKFRLIETSRSFQISEKMFYLGEIPRSNAFESQTTDFVDELGIDDFVPDDSALAIIQDKKLIVVSGCAHSGICNICEAAKKVTGISEIMAVIGGFHLKQADEQTRQTIRYFKEEKISRVIPSHCTELPALAAFYSEFSFRQLKTGQILTF